MARTRTFARNPVFLACLVLATPFVSVPATAAPLRPASTMTLSVQQEMGKFSITLLNCEPAGGLHRNAKAACEQLSAVDADFTKMQDPGVICTMELNRTKATLRGKWRGKKVKYTSEYSNPCQMRAYTGKIFDF